jgi:acyl-CoA reductase-like NAD-dependent aldehyde dehydrogenase
VEASILDDALAAMAERAARVKLGDGLVEDTTMGPLVSAEQLERVERYLEIGRMEAELVATGRRPADERLAGGFFAAPAIFRASNDATIAREEIFGPVMTVIPFKDPDEVVRLANDSDYGLAAAVWTRDVKKALTTARALRAGVVWINDTQPAPTEAPWGGYKQSGIGRELGAHGIDDYLEAKHIYVNLAP